MESVFNLAIGIHEAPFTILLVVLPHANIVIATGVDVPAKTVLKLFVELSLVNVEVLGQVSTDSFSFVLRIQLPDVAYIIDLQLAKSQIVVQVDGMMFLNHECSDGSKLSPLFPTRFMIISHLTIDLRFSFKHFEKLFG